MSIINSFDNITNAIINPADFASPIEHFPEIAVVAFSETAIEVLKHTYNPEKISETWACITVPIYKINFMNHHIAVYCSTLGGAAAAFLMESIISKGAKKIVFFGSCGVLDNKIDERALIIPTAAYRDEGVSYHYLPIEDNKNTNASYVNIPTAEKLAVFFSEMHLPYACGKVWTTDAFFRETEANTEKRKQDGCIAVDMECASIMAVAQFRDIEVYQFLYAADNLDSEAWDARTLGELPENSIGKFLRIALEVAVK